MNKEENETENLNFVESQQLNYNNIDNIDNNIDNNTENNNNNNIDIENNKNTSDKRKPPERNANFFSSLFNLCNAVVGAGALGFPYAFASTGAISGVIITVFFVILSGYTLHIICKYQKQTKVFTYQDLIKKKLGRFFGLFCEFIILIMCIGSNVIYLTVVGDCFEDIAEIFFSKTDPIFGIFCNRRVVILFFSFVIILPFCLLKQINFLGYTSILAVLGAIYLTFYIIIKFILKVFIYKSFKIPEFSVLFLNYNLHGFVPQLFMALPIIAFSFLCHILVVPVYAEMKNPKLIKMDLVIILTLIICSFAYCSNGVFGSLTFGKETKDDILKNYDKFDYFAIFGRAAIGITAIFSFPLSHYVARLTYISLFFKRFKINNQMWYFITIIYFSCIVLVTLFVPGLTVVFGYSGSIGAVIIIFILPGFLMIGSNLKCKFFSIIQILLGLFYIVFGFLIGVFGVTITTIKLFIKE